MDQSPNQKKTTLSQKYRTHWFDFMKKHTGIGTLVGLLLGVACVLVLEADGLALLVTTLIGAAWGLNRARYLALQAPSDLTDWQIALLPTNTIQPFDIDLIEPDSYDVTLGNEFLQILPNGKTRTVVADELIVKPGECWLAHTQETFRFPNNIKGILQGKSSWARLSLFVECAGLFDKGFEGTAVLELYNAGTWGVRIRKGDRIAQMSFHRTLPASAPYGDVSRNSHYQEQTGAKASWLTKQERVVATEEAIQPIEP